MCKYAIIIKQCVKRGRIQQDSHLSDNPIMGVGVGGRGMGGDGEGGVRGEREGGRGGDQGERMERLAHGWP